MVKISLSKQLSLANKTLQDQNLERALREEELLIANKELAYQNSEKEKRAAELVLANIELLYQNGEKEKRAAELVIANRDLILQNEEKEKKAVELIGAYRNLKNAEEHLKDHILGLEEMMFITSHKVRKPVANIIGLTNMLDDFITSPVRLRKLIHFLKLSAEELDSFTKELTEFIGNIGRKEKP